MDLKQFHTVLHQPLRLKQLSDEQAKEKAENPLGLRAQASTVSQREGGQKEKRHPIIIIKINLKDKIPGKFCSVPVSFFHDLAFPPFHPLL